MTETRKIAWEFYNNPLKVEDELLDDDDSDLDDDEDEEDEYDSSSFERKKRRGSKPFRALMTSFGMIPITEDLLSNKTFKLWVGHTNFSISLSDASAMADVSGVEAIKFFSRYRFLLCVGKLFNTTEVKLDIQSVLCGDGDNPREQANLELDKRTRDKVDKLILEYDDVEHWIIYVLPNGKIIHYKDNNYSEDFNDKLILLTNCFKLIGGYLLGS